MSISICIPTYNRPAILKQAIESCLIQTHKPTEIIICDDSTNDLSEKLVAQIRNDTSIQLNYFRNIPGLGQVKNVNRLFDLASCEKVVLLHDDDLLHEKALENLNQCFIEDPSLDIVYGKQYIMDDNGVMNEKQSEGLNNAYYRNSYYESNQLSPIEAGIVQQFPNDCYMIKTEIVKENKYDPAAGDACDFEFGLRLGIKDYKMRFVNKYTAYYRHSEVAVSTNSDFDGGLISYRYILNTAVPDSSLELKKESLKRKSTQAIIQAINKGQRKEAISIYFSKWHRHRIFTLGGAKRLLYLFK